MSFVTHASDTVDLQRIPQFLEVFGYLAGSKVSKDLWILPVLQAKGSLEAPMTKPICFRGS